MENEYCFVAVEFVNDPNVAGLTYWYLCPFDGAAEGVEAVAPLGRHNNCQKGIVRCVKYATEENAPYPVRLIKCVKQLVIPV
ncbi:MAG: hypothetical protein NC033_06300 [Clostridiales bacterium]|nr:hypothetical protein [Clostridiales bacterium]